MSVFNEEKGLTLIETLLSIVILSIVLTTFINFFPQMGRMNKQNEEKIQAINLAKQILVKWQEEQQVKDFLFSSEEPPPDLAPYINDYVNYSPPYTMNEDEDYFSFKTTKNDFNIEITIYTSDELTTSTSAYQIHIAVINNKGVQIGESYGYIMSD